MHYHFTFHLPVNIIYQYPKSKPAGRFGQFGQLGQHLDSNTGKDNA